MSKTKKFLSLVEPAILFGVISLTFIIDSYIRPSALSQYNNELRNIDHILAGIGVPQIFKLSYISKLEKFVFNRFVFYGLWATFWETTQFLSRGYFQFDQYLCDLTGIIFAILIHRAIKKIQNS